MREQRKLNAIERWTPVAYLAVASLLVVAVLPTALRPPEPPPPTSAEFNPNAPPEDESIIFSGNRGVSGTAGSGPPGLGEAPTLGGDGPPVPGRPKGCPRGFGNPPRQTESVYAAPCLPAFVGDNGGATWKGVTATEVRVTVVHGTSNFQTTYEGWVPETRPQGDENSADRTYRVYQEFFNRAFQFYGRKLRIYSTKPGLDEASQRAKAAQADAQGVFAGFGDQLTAMDEMARRKIVAVGGYQFPLSAYADRAPYAYSWHMDGTKQYQIAAEYVCKKLAGKNARFAGDPTMQDTRRKFGLIEYDDAANWGAAQGPVIVDSLKKQCGVEPVYVRYNYYPDYQGLATSMARFRSEGVTSIIMLTEYQGPPHVTAQATAQGYYPEWIITGRWLQDHNFLGQASDQTQWRNAFGISSRQPARPHPTTDFWRAYKEIDPDNDPNTSVGEWLYYPMLQMVNAIQMAGPNLTPESFNRGLRNMGYRFGGDNGEFPVWMVGGGYGPRDYTWADDVVELWWDPTGNDPQYGYEGAYKFVRNGKRYRLGEIPREDPLVFRDGVVVPE